MAQEIRRDFSPAGSRVKSFIAAARRRMVLSAVLQSLILATLLSETWRWGTALANRLVGARMPVFTLGFYLLPAIFALYWRRLGYRTAVARTDRSLGLKDRLVSFVDFSGRGDIDEDMRKAQETETAEKISRVDLRRGLRIHPFLWCAPFAFLLLVGGDFFSTSSIPPLVHTLRGVIGGRVVPGAPRGQTLEEPQVREAGPGEADRVERAPDVPPPDPAVDTGAASPDAGRDAANRPDRKSAPGALRKASGKAAEERKIRELKSSAGSGDGRATGERDVEPARIFSETVGKKLTPVALNAPGRKGGGISPPPPPLKGKQVFNLLPGLGPESSSGNRTGMGEGKPGEPLQIVVDFDSVPAEYREYVRRYFIKLSEGG